MATNWINSKFYRVWSNMLTRCYNPKTKSYSYYGGRGIAVCSAWHQFENFYNDMEDTYEDGLIFDRIDPNKGYSKENCRWVTKLESARNKTTSHKFEFNGRALNLQQWADRLGIKRSTLAQRIYSYGWPVEKALSTGVI